VEVASEASQPAKLEWKDAYDFQNLMARRVEDIILVSSTYDTFILQEDGRLGELLLGEFLELNLHHTTGLTHVSSGAEALALAKAERRFNLIIASLDLGDMDAAELARQVRNEGLDVPVIILAYDGGELVDFLSRHDASEVERIFLWQGDPRILLAITKYMEDKLNVAYDTGVAGVQVILLIEDNIRYYSAFLPVIYTEIIRHSQGVIEEGVNTAHKILRMRARPKILLCTSYEEAWEHFSAYQEEVLGVISDVDFPKEGSLVPGAGMDFARRVKEAWQDIPILLQSSRPESETPAREVGAGFLLKGSPTLLTDLRRFVVDNFFFADFVFRMPDGTEVAHARDLKGLLDSLRTVPAESINYHAERNDFSRWLKARTEFRLAHLLRPRTSADYDTIESRRRYLVEQIDAYRRELTQESVCDFHPLSFDPENSFARIGGGSLGGKARSLAFVRHLLRDFAVADQFKGIEVTVPPGVVLGTDVFDLFLQANDLREFAMQTDDDRLIEERFLAATFPAEIERQLETLLEVVDCPLAVRSSSLLEDSQYQPLAGVYQTYMLPNNHADRAVRLAELVRAVKRVFASTFLTYAKNYFKVTPYRLEEEKMAVLIQRIVGSQHDTRFYPSFAGVARSHNFYPTPPLAAADGVTTVALGLGRTVVGGGRALSFCPRHPQHLVQFSAVEDKLANSQREFIALDLQGAEGELAERSYPLSVAEADGTLWPVASTYSPEDDAVYDGLSRPGVRLVSFAPMLKERDSPLFAALDRLLELGCWGMNAEVEIEFAVELGQSGKTVTQFGFLQMRPMAISRETEELDIGDAEPEAVLASSSSVLGNGKLTQIKDVVVVSHARFDRGKSVEIAGEVAKFNAELAVEGTPYLLIGLGRWGSADPWLGIPVTWEQISGARVIVESGLKDIVVTPSQGSHFFQNLTSFRVGYFTVNPEGGEGSLDWDWLESQPAVKEGAFVRHLRFAEPLVVKINGKQQRGVILKPHTADT
jgi:CheY-like chemotaxis protein